MAAFLQLAGSNPEELDCEQLAYVFRAGGLNASADELSQLLFPFIEAKSGLEELLEGLAEDLSEHEGRPRGVLLLRAIPQFIRRMRNSFGSFPDADQATEALLQPLRSSISSAEFVEAVRELLDEVETLQASIYASLLRGLLLFGLVHPADFMSVEAIRAIGDRRENWSQAKRDRDPRLPSYWADFDPAKAVEGCRRLLEREPIESLASLMRGVDSCLSLQYGSSAAPLYVYLPPILQLLCRRRRLENAEDDRLLTFYCWRLGMYLEEGTPPLLEEDYASLKERALSELGRLRSVLRQPDAASVLPEHMDHANTAAWFALSTDPSCSWEVIRRYLLLFRGLPRRSVPLDLRTWDEAPFAGLPQPWGRVPSQLAHILESFLGKVLVRDPELRELRRKLAQYCLDRLKTQEKAEGPITSEMLVEPDASWRQGYIHAVGELASNLGEREVKVLRWSAHNDPDEEVRALAKAAHERARRGSGLPADASPRRSVFAAFWYLRQAHVVSFGDAIDEAGAKRTHRKEMRRQA